MIGSLRIQNLATIEDLELRFQEGFSIVTGETGAGKSIIIDGLKLVLGEKASAELIRTGKSEAAVEAIFRFPAGKKGPEDLPFLEDDEVFIQRQISQDGPGKAYLNGVLVPVKKLKEIGAFLVDIYGQNDHIFLLQIQNHLDYLDSFLGLIPLRDEVSSLARGLHRLVRQQNDLEVKKREREQRLDFLGYQIKEIEDARLNPGEWEEILTERNILKNAEKISTLVSQALDAAYLGDHSIAAALVKLQEVCRELGRYDETFRAHEESIGQSAIAVQELADVLIKFQEKQSLGPERLEEIESRLSTIEKLRRKYGETIQDILLHLAKIKEERDGLVHSEERLADLEAEIGRCFEEYKVRAQELSRCRRSGARELESRVEKEISLLGMKRARFKVKIDTQRLSSLEPDQARDLGPDEIEFLISPNPGEELRALRKIASGGELSRIMLALKTVGKEKSGFKTLIFDEIDSGIGGKTADCIAEKLSDLARRHQVICVTHLPQIASFAPVHFRIEKSIAKERTFTTVKELDFEERVKEISRLLSGSHITSASLQNAREMLLHNLKKSQKGEETHEPIPKRR
jgi:DNA repair protein RecN (Recombination protein N)